MCNIMSKLHSILQTRTSCFISSAEKIENVQECETSCFISSAEKIENVKEVKLFE